MPTPAVEIIFDGDRIAFSVDGGDINVVYLTKRALGCLEMTVESDSEHQHGAAVTQTLSKPQVDALRKWLQQ